MTAVQQATSSEVQKEQTPARALYFMMSGLLAASAVLWWNSLLADVRLALTNDAYTYILLIIPLSISLICVEGSGLLARARPNRPIGVGLLSVALLVWVVSEWNFTHFSASWNLTLNVGALVVWWIGTTIFCFGFPTFRSLLFPLCLLFLIVPLPERGLNWITAFLQQQSAAAASMLFALVGVPVTHDGVVLSIPGLTIEVAHECSSIRSCTILVVMTLLLAHLFLKSAWRKTVLVLAAIPLSVAKNAIRIFTIAELGTRVNPSFLHGSLHQHGGVVFLGLAVLMTIVLLWVLRKSERRPDRSGP